MNIESSTDPVKKSMFPRVGLANIFILLSLFLFLQGVIAGCQSRTDKTTNTFTTIDTVTASNTATATDTVTATETDTVTAMINYGPFGSIELPRDMVDKVMTIIDSLPTPTASSSEKSEKSDEYESLNAAVWPLDIRFSPGGRFSIVTAYPDHIMVDGLPLDIISSSRSRFLAETLRQDFLSGLSFPEAFNNCDSVRLTSIDVPGLELSLDSVQQRDIGSLIQELSMKGPDSGYGGAAYPGYVLTLDWNGIPITVEWTAREYVTFWTGGVYGALTWYDPDGEVWQACLSLFPPPLPEELQGLSKLFSSTGVRASGGDLGEPIVCDNDWWHATILLRLLQKGQVSSDNAPSGEPVTITFADTDNEWKVYLYENGFIYEEQYYRFDNIERTFLTTMNSP